MPPQLQNEAAMLLGERLVLVLPTPLCHPPHPPTKAILRRLALNDPDSMPRTTPVVGKSKEVKRTRPLDSVGLRLAREPRTPERNQPGLFGMKRQAVFGKALRQHLYTRRASGSHENTMTTSS